MKQVRFEGVIPILATPFRDDESLDPESWQRLLEFMVGLGVDGVTILGVLGESNRLSDHERQALIEQAVSRRERTSADHRRHELRRHPRGNLPVAHGAGTRR